MKQNLIDKAIRLIESKGAEALSMRGLAKRAGTSTMAAYRHFSSKDELLLEVAAQGFEMLTTKGIQAAEKFKKPKDRLEAAMLAYFHFGQKHRYLFELMFGPIKKKQELSDNFQRSAKASFTKFAQYVEEYLGDIQVQKEKFQHQSAANLWAFIHGLTVLTASGYLKSLKAVPTAQQKQMKFQIKQAVRNLK